MDLTGETTIAAPPERVWAALIDPALLASLIPGCESMTGNPAEGYAITASRGVGSMTARLSGRIDLTEADPPRGCRLVAQGTGGAAGLARGTARIRLDPVAAGTRLSWTVRAEVGGRLAALPGIIVSAAARRVADGFVGRFKAAVEGTPPPARGWLGRLIGG